MRIRDICLLIACLLIARGAQWAYGGLIAPYLYQLDGNANDLSGNGG